MWQRLRSDFQLAMVVFFGGFAVLGIVPFALYRFSSGNQLAGVMDTAIILSIGTVVTYAWRSGDSKRAALVLVLITNIGCIASATVLGLAGLFWTFPNLLVNFLLLDRRRALLVSVTMLGFLAIHGVAFESTLELVMFLVTAAMTSLFAFIFAFRTETQRQQLESLALRDPLTGIQNRRAMERELAIACKGFDRNHGAVGVAMLDLDHFKRINDHYGHEAGDDVLIAFTEVIQRSTRTIDRFFRFGGEEFVLLLPGADCASLRTIGDNLCNIVSRELQFRGETITVSIGAAELLSGEDAHAWLARADAALYAAKDAGRNRTVVDRETAGA